MKIIENFVENELRQAFANYHEIYDESPLIQYLDQKMGAVHGDSKTRRSLSNIYAIYSILHFYRADYANKPEEYKDFEGYEFTKLLKFSRSLYGGNKLQNHSYNSRVNGEFKNKVDADGKDLIVTNNGKYLLHIDHLYVGGVDLSEICCNIIEKYIDLLKIKDEQLAKILEQLKSSTSAEEKKRIITDLLTEDSEARIFEIISYAVLRRHFYNIKVFFGSSLDTIEEMPLSLYKTGRTNANDGGIDFVMRPIGRFFQVTEVNNYAKYLLDIDKVMHFPVTFVIKTELAVQTVKEQLEKYITQQSGGMAVIEQRYREAIEEVITINELKDWLGVLSLPDVDEIISDIEIYYKLEMNIID